MVSGLEAVLEAMAIRGILAVDGRDWEKTNAYWLSLGNRPSRFAVQRCI